MNVQKGHKRWYSFVRLGVIHSFDGLLIQEKTADILPVSSSHVETVCLMSRVEGK